MLVAICQVDGHLLKPSALHRGMMQTDPKIQFQNNFSQLNWKCKDTEILALPWNLFGKNLCFRAWNKMFFLDIQLQILR